MNDLKEQLLNAELIRNNDIPLLDTIYIIPIQDGKYSGMQVVGENKDFVKIVSTYTSDVILDKLLVNKKYNNLILLDMPDEGVIRLSCTDDKLKFKINNTESNFSFEVVEK